MSLGENSLVAAYQGKGQLKSRPSGIRVVTYVYIPIYVCVYICMNAGLFGKISFPGTNFSMTFLDIYPHPKFSDDLF